MLYCAKKAGVTHILKAGGAQVIWKRAWLSKIHILTYECTLARRMAEFGFVMLINISDWLTLFDCRLSLLWLGEQNLALR